MSESEEKHIVAICYDFDGTLAPGNMQEYDFIPKTLEMKTKDFWDEVKKNAKENDMDEILSYLELILKKAKQKNKPFNKKSFIEAGRGIEFFKGVETWFNRINQYAQNKEITLEHYIISSGLKPMIEGSAIVRDNPNRFKKIFACDFNYDGNHAANFPAAAVNYTTKTQYLFRINKHSERYQEGDLLNNWNNEKINEYIPGQDRRNPFSRMIYLGDGETDVPAMKMVKFQGGYSIGVFKPNTNNRKSKSNDKKTPEEICQDLLKNGRCSYIASANYEEGKNIDKIIKLIIDKISSEIKLKSFSLK